MKKDYLKYIVALLLFGSNGIVASRIDLSSLKSFCYVPSWAVCSC